MSVKSQNEDKSIKCPICNKYTFNSKGNYDICKVCFWENDDIQYDDPNFSGGANNLSLNDYKKWWEKLNTIVPTLMKKYKAKTTKLSLWDYDEISVPRENIKDFINELTNSNIEIRLSFYYLCKKYKYDSRSFVGFPFVNLKTIKETNNECLNIIFTENPMLVCEKYKLKQVSEILGKSQNVTEFWQNITPHISIMPNPTIV